MNRRGYLKTVVSVGVIGASSFSVFKWFNHVKNVDSGKILGKRELIAEIAELIIPETDTPGAKTAGVDRYIIDVLINCNSVKQQNKFYSGLEELEAYALNTYRKEFMHCSSDQKQVVLQYIADHAEYSNRILNKINNKFFGQSFFVKMKSLTVEGYCSSRLGATQGLAYDYIPATFEACTPLEKNQKSWATK